MLLTIIVSYSVTFYSSFFKIDLRLIEPHKLLPVAHLYFCLLGGELLIWSNPNPNNGPESIQTSTSRALARVIDTLAALVTILAL